jgi:hypothetical protein
MLTLADSFPHELLQMPTPLFMIMGIIAIVAIVAGAITKVAVSRSRERTKRDIAAYVAEGSIDADKAVAMLKAGEEAEA